MQKGITWFLFLVIAVNGIAQNAKEDFFKINQAYLKYNSLAMNITYNLYANHYANTVAESENGVFKQQEGLRYSKLKGVETVQNKEYQVVVDNDEKMILIGNPVKFNPKTITMLDLEQTFSLCATVQFMKNTAKSQNGYKLILKSNVVSEFEAIDLYYNKTSYLVERMVFYYREKMRINEEDESLPKEKPKLEIVFSNMSFSPMERNLFSEQRFISKNKDKYIASANYNGYEVINQKLEK